MLDVYVLPLDCIDVTEVSKLELSAKFDCHAKAGL